MKDRTFWITLGAVTGTCLAATLTHFAYAVYAYQHASIIYFVARELWG